MKRSGTGVLLSAPVNAAVLRDDASPALLDSYEAGHKPFAELVVNASVHNLKQWTVPELDLSGLPEPVDQVELALGYRCRSTGVLIGDDDPRPTEDPNRPSGRAGFRAPHVPITVGGPPESTVDFFGPGWVLVTADPSWRRAAATVGEEAGALDCRVLGRDFLAPEGLFLGRYGVVRPDGATLVRSDGVVAWRTVSAVDDRDASRDVLARVLDR